ncbi:MAG TPA: hypothetical protein VMJ32_11705 [Pirellulales bacterium]|nr:hypothetical protein [Pirellulales bacterium]
MDPGDAIVAAKWTWGVGRWIARRKFVRRWSDKSKLKLLTPLHHGFLHAARRLSCQMHQEWDRHHAIAANLAVDVCTACRMGMGGLVNLSPNQLHCCLKVVLPQIDGGSERVGTWGRSTPTDGRPQDLDDDQAHLVDENSVWCALTGRFDGETHWPEGLTCFSCNDLAKYGSKFHCTRPHWSKYYHSVLVFPLRYAQNTAGTLMGNVGFLAFDSHKTNAFPEIPDIFNYVERPAEYLDALHKTPAFHLGALFADTLGTFLGSAYDSSRH